MNKRFTLSMVTRVLVVLLSACIMASCASRGLTTIVGGKYDEKKDATDYFVFPFGEVSLPGKWEKGSYTSISRQQFFRNSQDVVIAIAFGPVVKYEFNADGKLTGMDFVRAYYKWETDYFETMGVKNEVIEEDEEKCYIIFRLYGKVNGEDADTYFLFGTKAKDGVMVSNYSVLKTDMWSREKKIEFLKQIF